MTTAKETIERQTSWVWEKNLGPNTSKYYLLDMHAFNDLTELRGAEFSGTVGLGKS